jgi:H+/gluconate symporter-like permease
VAGADRLAVYYFVGLVYLERQRRKAQAKNEGYGTELLNEPETPDNINLPNPIIAISPLILVGVFNLLFTRWIPQWYGATHQLELPGLAKPITTEVGKITAIWAVEAALISGILLVVLSATATLKVAWRKAAERRLAARSSRR